MASHQTETTQPTPTTTSVSGSNDARSSVSSLTLEREQSLGDLRQKVGYDESDYAFLYALDNLRIEGRAKEILTLRDAYARVVTTANSEVVFVSGESGSGKSSLVEILRKPVTNNDRCYFASGKFDQLRSSKEPYSAFAEAFSDICILIEQGDARHKARVAANLRSNLVDDEISMLSLIISNLPSLVGMEERRLCSFRGESSFGIQAFIKFKLLCRKFLQSVATREHPVVLFVDDLQWADRASKDVFQALCSDPTLLHTLILAAYRKGEGYEQQQTLKPSLPTTLIHLGGLDIDAVNEMVSSVTQMDKALTLPLSEVVEERTGGSPHFTKIFLESLNRGRLLTFCQKQNRWEWDLAKISEDQNESSKALIRAKLRRVGASILGVLKLASCLGYNFNPDHVLAVAGAEYSVWGSAPLAPARLLSENDRSGLIELLTTAMKERLVEKGKTTLYKFKHDIVFEAVQDLLPSGNERQQLHLRIGACLLQSYGNDDDAVTLLVTDQLNLGSPCMSPEESLCLAERNMHCAKLARSMSAFQQASDYVRQGLLLLPPNMWNVNYDLTLELHTVGATLTQAAGTPLELAEAVVLNGRCMEDKLPVLQIMVDYYSFKNQHNRALELGQHILQQLGEQIPLHPGKAFLLWELVLTRRAIGSYTDEDLVTLRPVKKRQAARILSLFAALFTPAYSCNVPFFFIVGMRSVRLSIQCGVHPEASPQSFAAYGILNVFLGKVDDTVRFQTLAVRMLDVLDSKVARCKTLYMSYAFGLHLRKPLEECLGPLLESYTFGMKYLDSGTALLALVSWLRIQFFCGYPLPEIEGPLHRLLLATKQYGQDLPCALSGILHQLVLNLMGRTDNAPSSELTGSAMNQKELRASLNGEGNEMALNALCDNCFQLHVMFGEWDRAMSDNDEMLGRRRAMNAIKCHFAARSFYFNSCLLHFVQFRRTGKRKHRRIALARLAYIRKSIESGCPNFEPLLPILNAERFSLTATSCSVDQLYEKAVNDCPYIHYKAFAHERAAAILLERFGDRSGWRTHLEKARGLYFEWGATAKVSHNDRKLVGYQEDGEDQRI